MKKPEAAWVLLYSHPHGNDITLYSTEAMALEAAIRIIKAWIDDILDDSTRNQIEKLISNRRFRDAVRVWHRYQSENDGETLEWGRHEVNPINPDEEGDEKL